MSKTGIGFIECLLEIWTIFFVLIIFYLVFTANNANILNFIITFIDASWNKACLRFKDLIPTLDKLLYSILIPKPIPH